MVWINVLGGIAVLGSYAHGLSSHSGEGSSLWGGVPERMQPLYTASMLLATAGYFAFTSYFLLRVDPNRARIGGRFGFGMINALYAIVLASAALWMPLTWRMLEQPSEGLWWAIRAVLGLTGAASVLLLFALIGLKPRAAAFAYALAVAGLVAFCFQTAVLDALVWPAFFRA